MLLKLQNYDDLTIKYVKEKNLHISGTLSRAYLIDSAQGKDLEFAFHAMIVFLFPKRRKLNSKQPWSMITNSASE